MSIESRIRSYEPVFREWQVKEYLGGGSGGQTAVFRVVRPHSGWEEVGALKVITIVEARGTLQDQPESFRQDYIRHRQALRQKAEQEVQLMYRLRDCSQVVNYQDYTFVNWQSDHSYGCDMLIRMEKLTSLEEVLTRQTFHPTGVLRVGRALTEALIRCHQEGIIHRDIKPANIFVTASGDYKLGDFGIARILDDSQHTYTSIGTRAYAAPEQSKQGTYDHRVDIYSLGLTLYELANQNRLPFASSHYVRPDEVQRRLNGEPLPPPGQTGPELAKVILKACAYSPDQRYQTARDFQKALEEAGQQRTPSKKTPPAQDPYATAQARPEAGTAPTGGPKVSPPPKTPPQGSPGTPPPPKAPPRKEAAAPRPKKKKRFGRRGGGNRILVGICLLGLLGYLGCVGFGIYQKIEAQGPNTYTYHMEDCTWEEALQHAEALGGKLVTVDNREELDFLLMELDTLGYTDRSAIFYLGGRRFAESPEGDYPDPWNYYWTDTGEDEGWMGREINRDSGWLGDLWAPGEPTWSYGGVQETCLTLECMNGVWRLNDVPMDLLAASPSVSGRVGYIVEYVP